jgi:hypothetical protein
VYWVSRQLGHADIGATLKHYARFLSEVHERNLGLLNGYLRVGNAADAVRRAPAVSVASQQAHDSFFTAGWHWPSST